MNDKLEPVRCGCGGEAKIIKDPNGFYISCKECMIETDYYDIEAEAIAVWNRAMGSAEKSSTVERTAKVENIEVEWGDDEYVHDRMGDMYHYGDCGNCGQTVSHNQKYCHECGAKLEWK